METLYDAEAHLTSPFDPTFRRMMGKYKEADQEKLKNELEKF